MEQSLYRERSVLYHVAVKASKHNIEYKIILVTECIFSRILHYGVFFVVQSNKPIIVVFALEIYVSAN